MPTDREPVQLPPFPVDDQTLDLLEAVGARRPRRFTNPGADHD